MKLGFGSAFTLFAVLLCLSSTGNAEPRLNSVDLEAHVRLLSSMRLDQLNPETRAQIEKTYLNSNTGLCGKPGAQVLSAQCNRLKRYFEIEAQFKKCHVPTNAA